MLGLPCVVDIRVAACGIICDERGMLLAHWNDSGHTGWTLPGGGIDPGEDPADAAVREVREETGYDAEVLELLGVDSQVISAADRIGPRPGALHALRIVYRMRVTGGELRTEVGGTTDDAAWIAPDDIAGLARVGLVDVGRRFAGLS